LDRSSLGPTFIAVPPVQSQPIRDYKAMVRAPSGPTTFSRDLFPAARRRHPPADRLKAYFCLLSPELYEEWQEPASGLVTPSD